jgi:KDO2-lipid IV(A) lauroyltransferase
MAQSGLELLYFMKNTEVLKNVRIEGREYLDMALRTGRGVVGLTAHFGNFPLMTLKLSQERYPVNVMLRNMRDPQMGEFVYGLCTNAGVKAILSYPRIEVIRRTISALRKNELVLIQMDQNFDTGGIWVNFFGKLAATPVGPIVFALRTKAVILPIYIIKEGRGKHCIKILSPQELEKAGDKGEVILSSAIKFTKIIEGWIRDRPDHWAWIHRRWKSKPSEKIINTKFKMQKL